jgi:hypothetical protein
MLDAADAPAFHWRKAGTDLHAARADRLLATYTRFLDTAPSRRPKRESRSTGSLAARVRIGRSRSRGAVLANADFAANEPALHAHHSPIFP